jgi:hypothetical protein
MGSFCWTSARILRHLVRDLFLLSFDKLKHRACRDEANEQVSRFSCSSHQSGAHDLMLAQWQRHCERRHSHCSSAQSTKDSGAMHRVSSNSLTSGVHASLAQKSRPPAVSCPDPTTNTAQPASSPARPSRRTAASAASSSPSAGRSKIAHPADRRPLLNAQDRGGIGPVIAGLSSFSMADSPSPLSEQSPSPRYPYVRGLVFSSRRAPCLFLRALRLLN